MRAHVALADDAPGPVVFGNVVGTGQNAVLAADALIVEVPHDPGHLVLFIGPHGTDVEARRIETMMARRGDVLQKGFGIAASVQESYVAPRFGFIQTVERIAGGDTGLAPRTGIEVDFERVLLSRLRRRCGEQGRVVACLERPFDRFVPLCKTLDRRQFLLFEQIALDQRHRRAATRPRAPRWF